MYVFGVSSGRLGRVRSSYRNSWVRFNDWGHLVLPLPLFTTIKTWLDFKTSLNNTSLYNVYELDTSLPSISGWSVLSVLLGSELTFSKLKRRGYRSVQNDLFPVKLKSEYNRDQKFVPTEIWVTFESGYEGNRTVSSPVPPKSHEKLDINRRVFSTTSTPFLDLGVLDKREVKSTRRPEIKKNVYVIRFLRRNT